MTLNDQKRIISLWMQFLDGNEIAFSQLYCLFFDDLLTYGRRDLNYTIDDQLFLTQDQGLSDEVYRMLRGLTGRQKEIIYLRFIHEMSFDEISEIMEINIQSARNLLVRSMEKLRKEAILAVILFFI